MVSIEICSKLGKIQRQLWSLVAWCCLFGSWTEWLGCKNSNLNLFVFFASWLAKILFSEARRQGLPKYLSSSIKGCGLWLNPWVTPRIRSSSHTLETVWAKKINMEATWLTFGLLGHRTGWSPCAHSMGNLFFSGDIVDSFSPLELPPPAVWKSGTIGKDFKKELNQPWLQVGVRKVRIIISYSQIARNSFSFWMKGRDLRHLHLCTYHFCARFGRQIREPPENPFNCGNLRVLKLESTMILTPQMGFDRMNRRRCIARSAKAPKFSVWN